MTRVLLVQPSFPVARKSLNHKDFLPIGLLKLASWRRDAGDDVRLRAGTMLDDFVPDEIYITSLFTYWSGAVIDTAAFYRANYPRAEITIGGIYASLQPDHCERQTGARVHVGVHPEAEQYPPDYALIDTDFQIVHASRGCVRRCKFCGTYKIEPEYVPKQSILSDVVKNHLVFYDNNLLANPNLEHLLGEIAETRIGNRVVSCESQSGIDGRLLERHPEMAGVLKRARFRNMRIAWDGPLSDKARIEQQLQILIEAGFPRKEIQVFILYNHDMPPEMVFEKVEQCYSWGVQVSDCRYRPLDLFSDGYNPQLRAQAESEYWVHPAWTDADVRGVRRRVRSNNICVRYFIPRERYDVRLEGLSFRDKRETARRLGITSSTYSAAELDRINAAWLARKAR